MTEYGSRPCRQHAPDPAAFARESPVADGIDTSVKHVEPVPLQPMVDDMGRDARIEELLPGDHPMLMVGQRRDEPVDRTRLDLTRHIRVKRGSVWHGGELGTRGRSSCAANVIEYGRECQ